MAVPPGTYRIMNLFSHSTVRCYSIGQISVRSTLENPGPFELWQVGDDQSIKNLGLDSYLSVDSSGNVVTGDNQDKFTFQNTDDGSGAFVISTGDSARRARDAGKVWNVDPPGIPFGNISVQPFNGQPNQAFTLVVAE